MPDGGKRLALTAVALLGVLAVLQHWFGEHRPRATEERVADEIVVASAADRGPGTLREALFAAASNTARTRVVLRAGPVRLKTALPPLLNAAGTVLVGEGEAAILDATDLGPVAVLDVAAAHVHVTGIAITGARGPAIVVRAPGFRLANARISQCAEGVHAAEGALDLTVESSRFEDNGVGIRISAPLAGTAIRSNRFSAHRDAAIWSVHSVERVFDEQAHAIVVSNRFENDRMGLVTGNAALVAERNEFVGTREAALYLVGRGATVRANQLRDGAGVGIHVQDAPRVSIDGNEITRHGLGLLVRASAGASVHANRLHGNGYGMAIVLGSPASPVTVSENAVLGQRYDGIVVIGDSPVMRRNQSLGNGHAGVRILDYAAPGPPVAARPFLDDNRASGNGLHDIVRGEYRVEATGARR